MQKLSINQVTTGMILAEPIENRKGQLLLATGTELSESHLTILQTWGIKEITIEGGKENPDLTDTSPPSELCSEQVEAAKEGLLPLFRHMELDHPAVAELLRLAATRKVLHD